MDTDNQATSVEAPISKVSFSDAHIVSARNSGGSESSSPSQGARSLLSLEGWRGLAHYHTETRRNVVKNKPQDRTPSDLYILEESVKNVKLIGDLPLAKRLEICRYLGYQKWEANLTVYQQGQVGDTFYIMFSGIVRASVYVEGVQEDAVSLLLPGDGFGELALNKEECKMTETTFTTERSEFLTLTKKDYESILKIQKTPEIRERVKFLKKISAFSNVSKQSLYRLASVLSTRIYTKNRAVTFQGDEAFEMFFIRSGECRIIMEITTASKPILKLPRVSTFVYEQTKSRHHKCKSEIHEQEKLWGRPSLIARFSTRVPSVKPSSFVTPEGLGQTVLDSPDLLRELAIGHARVTGPQSDRSHLHPNRKTQANIQSSRPSSVKNRSVSVPTTARVRLASDGARESYTDALSPWGGSTKSAIDSSPRTPMSRKSRKFEPVDTSERIQTDGKIKFHLPLETLSGVTYASLTSEAGANSARFKQKEMQHQTYDGKKRRGSKLPKYTLSKFLREVEAKDKHQSDIDFSVKEHALWQMSASQTIIKSNFADEVSYYRNKFQNWARGVLDREKQLLGFNAYAHNLESPSFTPGADSGVQRLEQGSGPEFKNRQESSMILDIGALGAGDYFGERGLLKKSRRAVSIVTVSPVDLLVLNVWDFHRHCDRDVIQALAAHDYRKEEQIYKQYLRNCRWERFKKKVLDDVLEAKAFRTYMRVGLKGARSAHKEILKEDKKVGDWR